jgi:hypothetical protein
MNSLENKPKITLIPHELTIADTEAISSSFVETFVYESTNPKEEHLGNLYIVGQIYSERKKKENAQFLIEITDLIKDEYYRNMDRDAPTSFKLSLKRLNNFLLKNKEFLLNHTFKINLSIAVIFEDSLLVASIGDGTIFVVRSNTINIIETDSLYVGTQKKKSSFSNVVKGTIERGDVIIMATPQIHKLGKEKIILFSNSGILINFLTNKKDEFKNLGLITIKTKDNSLNTRLPKSLQEKPVVGTRFSRSLMERNKAEIIARILLILFIIVAVIAITSSAIATKKEVTQKKNKAAGIISRMTFLNDNISSLIELENYQEAEIALRRWEEQLEILEVLGVFKDEIKKQERHIDSIAPKVRRHESVLTQEILNLQGNSVGFNPTEIFKQGENIVLSNENILYIFDTIKKTGSFTVLPDISIGDEEYPLSIRSVCYSSELETFFLLSKDMIVSYSNRRLGSSEEKLVEIKKDERLLSAKSISFFNNKIYILGPQTIWHMDPQETELDSWLKVSNFNELKDFTIDGFIYALQENNIQKLLNGEKNIEMRIDKNIKEIFTTPSFKNLYLLNSAEGFVTIMDKFGSVSRRITNEKMKGANSFIIDSNEKTLLFLSDKRVFSISL